MHFTLFKYMFDFGRLMLLLPLVYWGEESWLLTLQKFLQGTFARIFGLTWWLPNHFHRYAAHYVTLTLGFPRLILGSIIESCDY